MKVVNFANKRRIIFVLAAGFVLTLIACGQKGPPRPPRFPDAPRVGDLEAVMENDRLKLSWSVPRSGDGRTAEPLGFKLYEFRQSLLADDCTDCPPLFVEIADIPVAGDAAAPRSGRKFVFRKPLETGNTYTYKIITYVDHQLRGSDSNIVSITY